MFIVVLLVILVVAVVFDFRKGIVPNALILTGLLLGIFYRCYLGYLSYQGFLNYPGDLSYLGDLNYPDYLGNLPEIIWQIGQGFLAAVVSVLVLYPLFKIGGLGAGDLKLFAVTGMFFGIKGQIICLCTAFVAGAVFSLIKMLRMGNLRERIYYFISYVFDILRTHNLKLYEQEGTEIVGRAFPKHKIHFTLSIMFGALFWIGGLY